MEGIERRSSTYNSFTLTNEMQNHTTQKQSMYPPGFPRKVILLISFKRILLISYVHFFSSSQSRNTEPSNPKVSKVRLKIISFKFSCGFIVQHICLICIG